MTSEEPEEIPRDVVLSWYRAGQPVRLPVWIQVPEETRRAMEDAATMVWLERIGALVAMFSDPTGMWSLVDGGESKRRAELIQAMVAETQRRTDGNAPAGGR